VSLLQGAQSRLKASEAVAVAIDGHLTSSDVTVRREDVVPYSAARLRRMLGVSLQPLVKYACHG
jgi:hypothetical protein